jgi:hypothetical protein
MTRFEVYVGQDGKRRWRALDEHGKLVPVKPGKVVGLEPDAAKDRAVENAVDAALGRLAAAVDHHA